MNDYTYWNWVWTNKDHITNYKVCDHEVDYEDVVPTLDFLTMHRHTRNHQNRTWGIIFDEILIM